MTVEEHRKLLDQKFNDLFKKFKDVVVDETDESLNAVDSEANN